MKSIGCLMTTLGLIGMIFAAMVMPTVALAQGGNCFQLPWEYICYQGDYVWCPQGTFDCNTGQGCTCKNVVIGTLYYCACSY
jgi:hypothetical protein